MPGAFHTELIVESQSAKIFLLDVNFKNPTTLNSHVYFHLMSKGKSSEVTCLSKQSYFECSIRGSNSQYSGFRVKAIRNGVIGKDVHYLLPLSFAKIEVPTSKNHSHHKH